MKTVSTKIQQEMSALAAIAHLKALRSYILAEKQSGSRNTKIVRLNKEISYLSKKFTSEGAA